MKRITFCIKSEPVLIIASVAALISAFFIPPSRAYIQYIDFSVLIILFCLMTVVAGCIHVGLFDVLSAKVLSISKSSKGIGILLVNCTFFSAMAVTNDVALITFVPLTIGILASTEKKHLMYIIVMETIAANIGSMLTPIGNPQNLYVYSFYNMEITSFLGITAPICIIGYILIMIYLLCLKNDTNSISFHKEAFICNKGHLAVYIVLFLVCICTVLHVINYYPCFFLVLFSVLCIAAVF